MARLRWPNDRKGWGDSMSDVRNAQTPEELQAIYRFRYEIYISEMGKRVPWADQSLRSLSDDLDEDGINLYIDGEDGLQGVARLNLGRVPPEYAAALEVDRFRSLVSERIAYVSKFIVAAS